ncbi:MAG: type I secretion system permease/ATPase [Variovorax sp.]
MSIQEIAPDAGPAGGAGAAGEADWELLGAFAQLNGIRADAGSLRQHFALQPGFVGLAKAAEAVEVLGLEAALRQGAPGKLSKSSAPVLACAKDGGLMIVAADAKNFFIVQTAGDGGTPRRVDKETLEFLWTGEWVVASRRAGHPTAGGGSSTKAFGVGWFWASLRKHKGLMGEVLLASFFIQVFALLTPLIFQVVIDKVLTHRTLTTLDVMVIALAGVSLFEVVLGAMRHYLFTHTTTRVDVELGSKLFRHLLHLPLSYFESRRGGETVARVRELENARAFLTGQALTSWLDLFFAAVFLAVMFYYSATLTLIVLAALPVFFLASWIVTPLLRDRLEDKFSQGAENQTFLVETVTSMETLKSHAVEASWQREWEHRLGGYVRAAFDAGQLGQATNQFIGLVSKTLVVVLLYFGARQVIDGALTVGALIAFNMLASRVNAPILKLASLWQDFTQMKVSIRRLADIMDAPAEPAFRPGRSTPPVVLGRVTFEHVSFRYAPALPEVLSELNMEIEAGEIVGVTGMSGAGKTTLMRLVQRLYTPERGRILLDGMDLHLADTGWLRRQIGVVGQDTLLFNRSVRDNIALGDPTLSMAAVMESARLAGADEFILELPDGYDTMIGERGTKLSGGQRARIAIARALATNPRLLLLDEATAALDYESERAVHDNMAQICRGRTVMIVAHRLSTLRLASRVLVLDRGRLVETGSHAELMRRDGRYRALYRAHQVLEAA